MSRAWRGGSTTAWRKLRAEILAENAISNGGRCTLAIPGVCTQVANVVHHTLGKAVTGDDRRYLAAVCAPCNQYVGEPSQAVRLPYRSVINNIQ